MSDQTAAFHSLLERYERALNDADSTAIRSLFALDGVLMAEFTPSAVGQTAIGDVYAEFFRVVQLSTQCTVEEVVEMSIEWAFMRTNSVWNVIAKATEETYHESKQELFILRNVAEHGWRIARFCFCSTTLTYVSQT